MRLRDLGRNVPNQYRGCNSLRHVYLPLALACVDARFTVIWQNFFKWFTLITLTYEKIFNLLCLQNILLNNEENK